MGGQNPIIPSASTLFHLVLYWPYQAEKEREKGRGKGKENRKRKRKRREEKGIEGKEN